MIDVDLDFIIKGIESQGATCTVKPRNASLRFKNNDLTHYGKVISFVHNTGAKEDFNLFVSYKEHKKFHNLSRIWNKGKLPQVFWFVGKGNTLKIIGDGMYI